MPATDAQIALIRDWVGDTTPTDEEISDKFDVEGSVDKTALSFLKRRRANLLQDPASWNGSDYSESWAKTLDNLAMLIKECEGAVYEASTGTAATNPGAPKVVPVDYGRSDRDRLFG